MLDFSFPFPSFLFAHYFCIQSFCTVYIPLLKKKKKVLNPLYTSSFISSAFAVLSFTTEPELLEWFLCIHCLQCHLPSGFPGHQNRESLWYHSCVNFPAKVTSQAKCTPRDQPSPPRQLQTCISGVPAAISVYVPHRHHTSLCPLHSPRNFLGLQTISTGTAHSRLLTPHILLDSSPSLRLQLHPVEDQVLMCFSKIYFKSICLRPSPLTLWGYKWCHLAPGPPWEPSNWSLGLLQPCLPPHHLPFTQQLKIIKMSIKVCPHHPLLKAFWCLLSFCGPKSWFPKIPAWLGPFSPPQVTGVWTLLSKGFVSLSVQLWSSYT